MRKAYSNIFIRLIKSNFTFSNDLRSPSKRAIRAYTKSKSAEFRMVNGKSSAPSFQPVRSPIHFYRVHSVSIRFGDNEERWRACSLGHSTEVEVGFLHLAGPAGEAGVAVAAPAAAGYWVVDSAEGLTFGETLKALDKTDGSSDSNTPNANGFVSTQTCANYVVGYFFPDL